MSRLKKNNKMTKTANYYSHLDSIVLGSGDIIDFNIRNVNNKPWFQITHESPFNASSYYDGPDFDKAYDLYKELLTAFRGPGGTERARSLGTLFQKKISDFEKGLNQWRQEDVYQGLKRKPLFLGIDDF